MSKDAVVDTRTFGEIMDSLGSVEKFEVIDRIRKVSMVADVTIRNWKNGHKMPMAIHQANVCKVLRSYLGIITSPKYLFPTK